MTNEQTAFQAGLFAGHLSDLTKHHIPNLTYEHLDDESLAFSFNTQKAAILRLTEEFAKVRYEVQRRHLLPLFNQQPKPKTTTKK